MNLAWFGTDQSILSAFRRTHLKADKMLEIQKDRASFERETAHTFAHDALGGQASDLFVLSSYDATSPLLFCDREPEVSARPGGGSRSLARKYSTRLPEFYWLSAGVGAGQQELRSSPLRLKNALVRHHAFILAVGASKGTSNGRNGEGCERSPSSNRWRRG